MFAAGSDDALVDKKLSLSVTITSGVQLFLSSDTRVSAINSSLAFVVEGVLDWGGEAVIEDHVAAPAPVVRDGYSRGETKMTFMLTGCSVVTETGRHVRN